jgi:hypothetical protein
MFVKTESGLMVPRLQAVLRPAPIGPDFISDKLLREVTNNRRHFVDNSWRLERAGAQAAEGGDLPVCPIEVLLECVERLTHTAPLQDKAVSQLWAFLTAEVSATQ